jgi:hypothetical protein
MSLTTISLNRMANAVLGSSSPATVYASLFVGATSALVGGTEASGGAYARKAITNDSSNFPAASGGVATLANAQAFAESTGAWSSGAAINCLRIYDALTGGNLLAGGMLKDINGTTLTIVVGGAGQTVTIPVSGITLTVTTS